MQCKETNSFHKIFFCFSYSGVYLMTWQFISHLIDLIQKTFRCEVSVSPSISKSTYLITVKG